MTSIFNGMENLVSINLDNFDSKNVESMLYMFKRCWKMKDIDFTKINGNKLINISKMIYNCDCLYELNLAD